MSAGGASVHDDLGAYLLGALEGDELERFEAHLGGCVACREEVEALRGAVDLLPAAATPVEPPPELRGRIMAVVNAEAQVLAASGPDADAAPERSGRRGWLSGLLARPGLAAAAAAGAFALAAAGGFAIGALSEGGGAGAGRTVAAQVTPPAGRGARAQVVVRSGRATLQVAGFRAPAPGREYQVWVTRGRSATPIATTALFVTGQDGSATVRVPGNVRGVSRVMVTPEPRGGSRTGVPSSAPIVVASLA